MQNGQPFGECRNAFRQIETEENERLRRPIIECSIRPERPASHVSEPFSFSQIKFASLQFLRRIRLLGNIQRVADQSRDLAILSDRISRAVHNPSSLFRMVDPIRHVDANPLAKDSLERFGYEIAIVRMQNGQPFRECRNAFRWIETENRKGFRRPIVKYSVRPERPTSHMSEPFSFAQIKFAPLQFLRRILLLGNIQRVADQSRDLAVLDDWLSRAVHNPFSLFRMVDPIRHVDANVLAKYSLERFGYAIAIVRMENGQPFRECRNAFRWVETEENERLRRPIIECSIQLQRPASHVSQPLSLSQVKFALLDIGQWALRPLRPTVLTVIFHFPRPFSCAGLNCSRAESSWPVATKRLSRGAGTGCIEVWRVRVLG